MIAVIQRVKRAGVHVAGECISEIDNGLLVLLGIVRGDTEKQVTTLVDKIIHLRIFEDDNDKMNRSLLDAGGELLVVSQFTLAADCRKGRRPSFTRAAPPEPAKALYRQFTTLCRDAGIPTRTGRFQARMSVDLVNDGPVTLILDTDDL